MIFHRFLTCLLIVAIVGVAGCTPHSNPMKDWKGIGPFSDPAVPESIKQDATSFFQTLSGPERSWWVNQGDFAATYWEDGTGQHAVILQCPHDGEAWYYALIYDRTNRRTKVLKYSTNMSGITRVSKCSDILLAGHLTTEPNHALQRTEAGGGLFLQSTSSRASLCR